MKDFNDIMNSDISDELLAAYIDGNTTESENQLIESSLNGDSILSEAYEIAHDGVSFGSNFDWEIHKGDLEFWELELLPAVASPLDEPNNINNILTDTIMEREIRYANSRIGEEPKIDVSSDVYQWYPDTCAIKSQQLVLEKYGVFVSQEELIEVATKNGWYTKGGGTPMEYVGNLLDYYGVPSTSVVDANVNNIVAELAQGHQVIVGVDANELHNNKFVESLKDYFSETPNHALIVAGIDTSDPNQTYVILKDPGTGDVAKPYPIEQFVDAWEDSSCFMVSTNDPAYPQFSPELINFDYQAMHMDDICGVPFDDYLDMNNVLSIDDMCIIDTNFMESWKDYWEDHQDFSQIESNTDDQQL